MMGKKSNQNKVVQSENKTKPPVTHPHYHQLPSVSRDNHHYHFLLQFPKLVHAYITIYIPHFFFT